MNTRLFSRARDVGALVVDKRNLQKPTFELLFTTMFPQPFSTLVNRISANVQTVVTKGSVARNLTLATLSRNAGLDGLVALGHVPSLFAPGVGGAFLEVGTELVKSFWNRMEGRRRQAFKDAWKALDDLTPLFDNFGDDKKAFAEKIRNGSRRSKGGGLFAHCARAAAWCVILATPGISNATIGSLSELGETVDMEKILHAGVERMSDAQGSGKNLFASLERLLPADREIQCHYFHYTMQGKTQTQQMVCTREAGYFSIQRASERYLIHETGW
ncbi:MAG: hypothetical protein WCP97_02945 [bacterium]